MKLTIDSDISKATSIDSEFYTEKRYLDLSLNKIFKKSWQLACHRSELLNINVFPFTLLENSISEPLVITKSDDNIKCLSNVCTHRGHIISEKACTIKKKRCGYHGRTFTLNGKIDQMPGFEGVKNFPSIKLE